MKVRKRIISAILALSMTAGIIPAIPAFAEEEAQLLKTERADMTDLPAGVGYFTMGNAQTNLPEKDGRYILTIYRDGDTSKDASVKVKTVDVSAVYGKDYVMDDDRYETVTVETEGTIMERFGKDEYVNATEESIKEINENSEMMEEAYEEQQLAGSDEADAAPAPAETAETEPQEKSALAQIKEAQTGLETRETYESEDSLLNIKDIAGGFDVANQMETSSYTTVNFAAGETEKQVIFKILDDGESEGQEMINFILSEPVDAAVTEPFTTTIVVEDDEPVEHSKVSFTSGTYNAENGTATITFKREGALYQYVTGVVKSKNGTAVSGTNFKTVNTDVEFLPYREDATIEIPVSPSAEATSFTLELSDLKGGDDGEIMSAEVVIAGSGSSENTFELMADDKITINNETFKIDKSRNANFARIYSDRMPSETVGYWVSPQSFGYTGAGGEDTPSYSTCGYDAGKGAGVLKWYSKLVWDKGYVKAEYAFNQKLFQSVWVDFSTHSNSESASKHYFNVWYQHPNGSWNKSDDVVVMGAKDRAVRGPVKTTWTYGYEDGGWKTEQRVRGDNVGVVNMIAERVAKELREPDMNVYGIILINKRYQIDVENADPVSLKTADGGTRKVAPGKVSVAGNRQYVYREGTLVFNNDPISGEKQKWGELIGYDITCGAGLHAGTIKMRPNRLKNELGDGYDYFATNELSDDCLTVNFTDALVDCINGRAGATSSTGLGYDIYLNFKPVYRKIPVKMNIIPADKNMGTFDSQYLKSSSTDQLFFGDEISLKASSTQENVRSDAYAFKAYETAGSTLADVTSDSTNYEENPTMQLCYRKYDLKPLFTDLPNHIQINADREVLKYFDLTNFVSGNTTNVDGLKGMMLLGTDRNGSITPVAGKAYKIELVPKKGVMLPSGVRPRITSEYNTSTYVDGYVMDIIAQAQYQQNRYKVTLEKYSGDYQYYDLKGIAQYASIAMMDNTKPLTNEPAKMNQVFAGGWLQTAKDAASGDDITIPQRQGAVTDQKGKIDIAGVKAIPGDVISVLVTNNNIDQVRYLKLSDAGAKEDKQFSEITGYKETENRFGDTVWESVVTQVTKPCTVVDMNNFEMPVKTAYAPYVRNVSLEYDTEAIAGNTTSVPLPDVRPLLTMKARVETNNTDVKFVEFIVYKSNGEPKGKIAAVTENSNGKISDAPQYTYRTEKPDADGYCSAEMESKDLDDGDQLFVRLVSNEKDAAGEYITYPVMNVGVTFYTPISEDDGTYVEVDLESMGEIPYVKTLSGKMDSGKLYFDTEYADRKNKRTSAYTKTVGISADLLHLEGSSDGDKKDNDNKGGDSSSWFNQDAFDKATNGQHSKTKESNSDTVSGIMSKKDPTGEANKMKKDLLGAYDEEIAKRYPNRKPTDKEKEAVAKEMYEKEAYKNSDGAVGSQYTVDMSAKVVLQFTYVYDPQRKEHVFGGGEYLIAATVGAEKIWTWTVSGVPMYIQVKGDISAQVDGTWINPDQAGGTTLTAKEMKPFKNMLDNRFSHKTEMPWVQIGLNVKLTAGVGMCGVLDAHGSLKLGLIFRFTFAGGELTTEVSADEKGGTLVDFAGSIGVTLLIVTIDIQLARIKQGWGKFDTGGVIVEGPSIDIQSVDEEEQERAEKGYTTNIRATKVGNERDGGDGWQLMSILKQVGEARNIKENTMERIEPQAVQLSNGNTFVVYVSGDTSNNDANAATLKYMIRNGETGEYSAATDVKADGVADVSPVLLYDPSKGEQGTVYVAWTSADGALQELTGNKADDLQITKNNLKTLEIYLRSYDVKTGQWNGEAMKLTDDDFVNSEAKLSIENGNIAVYYFKRNIEQVNKVEDILSMTQNYNTWAKQLINPATGERVVIGQYANDDNFGHHAGDNITEELLYVTHPTVADPLILDLSTETYTYKYEGDDPIEYGLATYTIDKDGSLETTKDHEVWLQIMNITNNKTYYPVLLDGADSGTADTDVSMPRLTKQGDDVLITWVKDGTKFNLISVKDALDGIRTDFRAEVTEEMTEEQIKTEIPAYANSALKVFADADAADRYWYRTAGSAAASSVGSPEGISANIATDSFPIVTKDFGTDGRTDALRKDSLIGDYHLVTGQDGNIYLFWAAASDNPDEAASSLYASAFYRVSAASQEKYGTQASYGFSDPVVISEPGLMIDELTAVVNGNLSALMLANTYERKWVDKGSDKDPFEDGEHNLTEFVFEPFNSLEVVNNEIAMYNVKENDTNTDYNLAAADDTDAGEADYTTVYEDYPKAGEKIMFSWSLKNSGLLPSVGHTAKLEVLEGNKVLYTFDDVKTGDGEQIYAGNTLKYTTSNEADDNVTPVTWEVPEGLNLDNVTLRLTVNELGKNGENLDEAVVVERKLSKETSLQYQEPYVISYSDMVDEFNNLTFENLPDVDFDVYDDINLDDISEEDIKAYLEKLGELLEEYYPEYVAILSDMIKTDDDLSYIDTYDYVVYVPVRNIGNNDSNVTAKLKFVNSNGEVTDEIIGETKGTTTVKPITTDSGELSYIAIPVDVEKKHYDSHGAIKGLIDIYEDGDKAIENIGVYIFEDGNVDFTLTSENDTIKLEKGETYTIETEAYPFDSIKDMEYWSDNTDVVTVSDDGVVTAVGAGTAEVTVTDNASGVTRMLSFEVTDSSSPTPTPTSKPSSGSGGSGGGLNVKVNVYNSGTSKNGKVSVSNSNPKTGDTVTVTVTPNEGYELDKLIVTDSKGNEIEVTKNDDGTFSFVQPDGKVTVKAEYKKTDSTEPSNNGNNGNNGNENGDKDWWFKDVPESAWYYAPIKEAYDAERMAGMSEDYFEPETDITRGMFASAIYRREGSPETDAVNKFDDVKDGSYYETAIAWATENGIVAGYDDNHYGPDDPITREQLAAILWRYAQFKEYDVSVGEDTNILDYTDVAEISEYAIPAIQWAVGDNVISGFEDGTMRPKSNANRAQMAVILNKIADMF